MTKYKELKVWVEDEKAEGVVIKISDKNVVVLLADGAQAICSHETISVIYNEEGETA